MDAQTVIESYVRDVTQRLRRQDRVDVALELRALLAEELAARAGGGLATETMAIELVRGFGAPGEVAARYRPVSPLLEASDTRPFLTWAIGGALVLGALAPITHPVGAKDAVTDAILAWLGLLLIVFATRNSVRRRWPSLALWRPRDPDQVSRAATLALVAVIGLGLVCYGAPQAVFSMFLPGVRLPPNLVYAPAFAATRLPWLLAIWVGQAVLLAWVAVRGRWQRATRQAEAATQLAVALVLIWFYVDGPLLQVPAADRLARPWVALIALGLLADVAWKVGKLMRRPATPIRPGTSSLAV